MNKQELIKKAKGKVASEITATRFEEVLDAITESITDALKEGGSVTLTGFGTFKIAQRAARKGRNPQTGKQIEIPAKKAAKFTPGKALKEALN